MDIESVICRVLESECAASVLEISGFDSRYGRLISEREGFKSPPAGAVVDRIDLTGSGTPESDCAYNNVYDSGALSDISKLRRYDVIIVLHLFENSPAPDAKAMLEELLTRAGNQVLVITPEYPYDLEAEDENKKSDVRAYHPVFFLGMDFSYEMFDTTEEKMQAYSFFPNRGYEMLGRDVALQGGQPDTPAGKLKIAYIITHHMPTGGMKVVFAQMKEMAKKGHHVTAYYRSDTAQHAVPEWCGIADEDISGQVVVPEKEKFLDYMSNEDIIILNWMETVYEFKNSGIPVALWENGTPALYGDYGKLISSDSWQRKQLHNLYRMPVYMLAVSHTVQAVLKGVYGREAQYFPAGMDTDFYCPPGIDTDFYSPLADKHNEMPTVLFVGNPTVSFKGFKSVFKILETAHEMGSRFKAQIAAQQEFALTPEPSFVLEKFINPAQEKLAELYRNADVVLSASLYESFPMPPIEAMASGTAVIAMDCGGINTYAEPGVNCLLCEQGDEKTMLYALTFLLLNPDARERLAAAGRETALRFSHANVVPELERCLYKIVGNRNRR